jgi:hypothetical protein
MRVCRECGEVFDEDDHEYNPASELGDIFLEFTWESDTEYLCPRCKEELGIVSLLGFDE